MSDDILAIFSAKDPPDRSRSVRVIYSDRLVVSSFVESWGKPLSVSLKFDQGETAEEAIQDTADLPEQWVRVL